VSPRRGGEKIRMKKLIDLETKKEKKDFMPPSITSECLIAVVAIQKPCCHLLFPPSSIHVTATREERESYNLHLNFFNRRTREARVER